jgi:hypothetical protein
VIYQFKEKFCLAGTTVEEKVFNLLPKRDPLVTNFVEESTLEAV